MRERCIVREPSSFPISITASVDVHQCRRELAPAVMWDQTASSCDRPVEAANFGPEIFRR